MSVKTIRRTTRWSWTVTSTCPDCQQGTITETYYRHPDAPFFPEVDPCEVCGAAGPFPPDEFPEEMP